MTLLAIATAQIHEVRATFRAIGSLILVAMCGLVLQAGLSAV